jgi:tRNA(Ile)-lysidine synthase
VRGLEAGARAAFERRLLRDHRRPVAVALSGGGDSLALTLMAEIWAQESGRDLLILTVDHRLREESTQWVERCRAVAARLDRPFQALAWTGDKPATGLPAAARQARHRLLADAARTAGAAVVLMGHTADDVSEAAAMRAAGATTPSPREWAPSPAWPAGRGVFILRPLLAASRADLRAWLTARGEAWVDDPANEDPRFARSRARAAGPPSIAADDEPAPLDLARQTLEATGILSLSRDAFRTASQAERRRFVALAAVCAGGGDRLPAGERADRLAAELAAPEPVVATLAGARIEADAEAIRVFRECGEARRSGLADAIRPCVWDGRFELAGHGTVRRLAGVMNRLQPDDRARLRPLPPAARGALPVTVDDSDGAVRLLAAPDEPSLVGARFRAAAGLVQREPA